MKEYRVLMAVSIVEYRWIKAQNKSEAENKAWNMEPQDVDITEQYVLEVKEAEPFP